MPKNDNNQSRADGAVEPGVSVSPSTTGGGGGTYPGVSVSPAHAGTHIDAASTRPASNLRICDSPFFRSEQTAPILTANYSPDTSLFVQALKSDPAEAVRFCDELLRRLAPSDSTEHRRWAGNLAMALREAGDPRGALRVCMVARPLLTDSDPLLSGCLRHSQGRAHAALREVTEGLAEYDEARRLFLRAGHDAYAASADNNAALLLIRTDRPREARPFVNRAIETWGALGLTALLAEGLETKAQSYLRESRMLRGEGR